MYIGCRATVDWNFSFPVMYERNRRVQCCRSITVRRKDGASRYSCAVDRWTFCEKVTPLPSSETRPRSEMRTTINNNVYEITRAPTPGSRGYQESLHGTKIKLPAWLFRFRLIDIYMKRETLHRERQSQAEVRDRVRDCRPLKWACHHTWIWRASIPEYRITQVSKNGLRKWHHFTGGRLNGRK